jgi:colanic acid/amylovoran biosynthesis glycosyltransferase
VNAPRLVLHMSYHPCRLDDRTIATNAKFLEVLQEYGHRWPGQIDLLLERSTQRRPIEVVEMPLADLPVHPVEIDRNALHPGLFPDDAVAYCVLEGGFRHLAQHVSHADRRLVRGCDVPANITAESLAAEHRSLPRKLKAKAWAAGEARDQRREVSEAAALHSNQYPAYDFFAREARTRHVFIDNPLRVTDLPNAVQRGARFDRLLSGGPLRLVFSGRLDPMKNPVDLADVAHELQVRDVPFEFDVFGDGPLRADLERKVAGYGLADRFRVHGFVDFRTVLLPFLHDRADVYVCPHRQGDPSTTYVEMMCSGVPIVSYPNTAVRLMREHHGIVTLASAMTPAALADELRRVHLQRDQLVTASRDGYDFGSTHTVEVCYQGQVDHLLEVHDRASGIRR